MEFGEIVEYIDDQKIICAVVTKTEAARLRLLTQQREDIFMTPQRLSHRSKQQRLPNLDRDETVTYLASIAEKRDSLAAEIDIQELWEVLCDTPEWVDLQTLTGLCFPEHPDDDHESAVIRAMFRSRNHFRFKPDRFRPHTPDEMARIRDQEKKAAYQRTLIDTGAAWLQTVRTGKTENPPSALYQNLIALFRSCILDDRESPHYETGRAILKAGDFTSHDVFFDHLVAIGEWRDNENVDLLRYHVPVDFPPQMTPLAESMADAADSREEKDRVDLTHLSTFTIDGQSTLDFDDALSIEPRDDYFLVGIHISDVARLIKKGDPLDQEALARGSSIYMPDSRISMIPPVLAENRLSLKKGERRPAISTMVKVRRNGEIISYDIFPSVIRVEHQLSYFEANINSEAVPISRLYDIALRFREKRLGQGAIQIVLPEVTVWLDASGAPVITRVNRESPGRLLVAEMMILSNWLSARFLAEKNIPAIFRSQPKPKARILRNGDGSVFQNWMQRKLLNRFALRPFPDIHCGLGLDAYVTATSPIRKYFDLVTQRQLRAALGLGAPYSREEIEAIIDRLTLPMANVGRIQFRRNRYWLLKHLENRIGEKEEALVLQRRRNTYTVLLKTYMIECSLPESSGVNLKPEDVIQVTVQRVNARNNTLSVFMG